MSSNMCKSVMVSIPLVDLDYLYTSANCGEVFQIKYNACETRRKALEESCKELGARCTKAEESLEQLKAAASKPIADATKFLARYCSLAFGPLEEARKIIRALVLVREVK